MGFKLFVAMLLKLQVFCNVIQDHIQEPRSIYLVIGIVLTPTEVK